MKRRGPYRRRDNNPPWLETELEKDPPEWTQEELDRLREIIKKEDEENDLNESN